MAVLYYGTSGGLWSGGTSLAARFTEVLALGANALRLGCKRQALTGAPGEMDALRDALDLAAERGLYVVLAPHLSSADGALDLTEAELTEGGTEVALVCAEYATAGPDDDPLVPAIQVQNEPDLDVQQVYLTAGAVAAAARAAAHADVAGFFHRAVQAVQGDTPSIAGMLRCGPGLSSITSLYSNYVLAALKPYVDEGSVNAVGVHWYFAPDKFAPSPTGVGRSLKGTSLTNRVANALTGAALSTALPRVVTEANVQQDKYEASPAGAKTCQDDMDALLAQLWADPDTRGVLAFSRHPDDKVERYLLSDTTPAGQRLIAWFDVLNGPDDPPDPTPSPAYAVTEATVTITPVFDSTATIEEVHGA